MLSMGCYQEEVRRQTKRLRKGFPGPMSWNTDKDKPGIAILSQSREKSGLLWGRPAGYELNFTGDISDGIALCERYAYLGSGILLAVVRLSLRPQQLENSAAVGELVAAQIASHAALQIAPQQDYPLLIDLLKQAPTPTSQLQPK